jgi:hypothetical protein
VAVSLEEQLFAAVQAAIAPAARYAGLVTQTNPQGSADSLLERPDVMAVLNNALQEAESQGLAVVRTAWESGGADEGPALAHLLDDIQHSFSSPAHLKGLIRHAHASVPPRPFTPGVSVPGTNPSFEAATERSAAVRQAIMGYALEAARRARMTVGMAQGLSQTHATITEGEGLTGKVYKRWKAHIEKPACCMWCRRLHGVTIPLHDSFVPYLGGAQPSGSHRKVLTAAGSKKFGLPVGDEILMHPPSPYHGQLQGPLLHPNCECTLELVTLPSAGVAPAPIHAPDGPKFLAASDIRDMPDDQYEAMVSFMQAAAHELGQLIKRMASDVEYQ